MNKTISGIKGFHPIDARLATAGQPNEEQLKGIKAAGFEAVINLALPTSDNALPNEGSIVTSLGMIYAQIPVDFQGPTDADLRAFSGIMEALENKRVFVHCAANMRVSAFVFLHRVLRLRVPIPEAERDLKAIWEPDEIWTRFIQEQLASRGISESRSD